MALTSAASEAVSWYVLIMVSKIIEGSSFWGRDWSPELLSDLDLQIKQSPSFETKEMESVASKWWNYLKYIPIIWTFSPKLLQKLFEFSRPKKCKSLMSLKGWHFRGKKLSLNKVVELCDTERLWKYFIGIWFLFELLCENGQSCQLQSYLIPCSVVLSNETVSTSFWLNLK